MPRLRLISFQNKPATWFWAQVKPSLTGTCNRSTTSYTTILFWPHLRYNNHFLQKYSTNPSATPKTNSTNTWVNSEEFLGSTIKSTNGPWVQYKISGAICKNEMCCMLVSPHKARYHNLSWHKTVKMKTNISNCYFIKFRMITIPDRIENGKPSATPCSTPESFVFLPSEHSPPTCSNIYIENCYCFQAFSVMEFPKWMLWNSH